MNQEWFESELRSRFDRHRHNQEGTPVSIKVRVESGCFDCGGCNPYMRTFLDRLEHDRHGDEYGYERHESGPEWIIYVAAGTVLMSLAKSIVELVTAVIKARGDGQKKGDKSKERIELIVRGFDQDGKLYEEKILKFDAGDTATEANVRQALLDGMAKHLPSPVPAAKPKAKAKKAKQKRN